MANLLPSKKQHALLEFIDAFIKENNYAPSYREVMKALDYKSVSTVASHINGLIERGWLVKRDNSARSVEVLYKTGQGQAGEKDASPTPSLPTHDAWLYQSFSMLLQAFDNGTDPEALTKARTLRDSMAILGFDELQMRATADLEQRVSLQS